MSNLHGLCLYTASAGDDASSSGRAMPPPSPMIKPKKRKKRSVANPNPNPNPNPKSKAHTSIYKTNIAVSPCSECGKQFKTWKALFGHMRCHPERQWRGMINEKQTKLKQKKQKHQDWPPNTDEVTRAALILMQISSGRSFRDVVACIGSSDHERKMKKNLDFDLNLPPPVEEDLS